MLQEAAKTLTWVLVIAVALLSWMRRQWPGSIPAVWMIERLREPSAGGRVHVVHILNVVVWINRTSTGAVGFWAAIIQYCNWL